MVTGHAHRFGQRDADDGQPIVTVHPVTQTEYDELQAKVAAYQPIIDQLRRTTDPATVNDTLCDLCDGYDDTFDGGGVRPHQPDCPWWLAQQLGGGE